MFRQVRVWARLGHSADEIQDELDERFGDILEMEKSTLKQRAREERERSAATAVGGGEAGEGGEA